ERDEGMRRISREQRDDGNAHRSAPILTRPWPLPCEPEGAPLVVGLEQRRAKQCREKRTVDLQRDVVAGASAATFPRPADVGAVLVVELDAIGRRVLAVARLNGDKNDCLVDAEQPDAASVTVGGGFKD